MQSCCFTGHRVIEKDALKKLNMLLPDILDSLYCDGCHTFRTGGALGFDTVAALAVLELKKTRADARLELILPCKNQSEKWDANDRRIYEEILANADSVSYISNEYTPDCMHERNRKLVEGSDVCIAYCTHYGGGSYYTCNYAAKKGLRVVNLANMIG